MACVCVLYLYHVLWLFSQRVSHRQRIVCVCVRMERVVVMGNGTKQLDCPFQHFFSVCPCAVPATGVTVT